MFENPVPPVFLCVSVVNLCWDLHQKTLRDKGCTEVAEQAEAKNFALLSLA